MIKYRFNWIMAFILSIAIHFSIFFILIHRENSNGDFGGHGGEIGKFESVMLVSSLPIGDLKRASMNSVEALPNFEEVELIDEIEKDKVITEKVISPIDSFDNINSEVEIIKPKEIKAKPKESKATKKKYKKISDKNINKDKPLSNLSGSINSVSRDNFSSAPIQGDGEKVSSQGIGKGKSKTASWQNIVMAHLNRYKKYPNKSLLDKEEGRVVVRVKIDKNGNVIFADIKKGCKFKNLNDEAVKLLKNASPLPQPPNCIMNNNYLIFSIPIDYDIKKYLKHK